MQISNFFRALAVSVLSVSLLSAQTLIDLRMQSKNVDFSRAQTVIPFPTGTALPATCTPGEMYFKSDAPTGSNLYGCSAPNTWTLQASGTSTSSPEAATPKEFTATLDSTSNTLTITCPAGQCNVQTGDVVVSYSGLRANYKPGSGSYTAFIYLENRTLKYGYPFGSMLTCTAVCAPGVTEFPLNAIQLYTATVVNGVFQANSVVDRRSSIRTPKKVVQGSNIVLAETADTITVSGVSLLRNQPAGIRPTCSDATRGVFWHTNGAGGQKDNVEVCAKDASDVFAWRTLY